jgi:hypothetical protein
MVAGCRSSGELTESSGTSGSVSIAAGPVKLVSIHGYVVTGSSAQCIVYDNTAASGTIVARMFIDAEARAPGQIEFTGKSLEFDMHGVLCQKGLFAVITTPAGSGAHGFTIEFA